MLLKYFCITTWKQCTKLKGKYTKNLLPRTRAALANNTANKLEYIVA